jgi:UDP-glucose 4-epimerase
MAGAVRQVANSTIMVTGGCGFIGSHLVRRLVTLGARRVVVIDSLRYGDRSNLAGSKGAIEIVPHTLGSDDPALLGEKLRGVNYLFHLAAEKHNQSKDSPVQVLRSNIDGTFSLFDAAARNGVEKIVFTSSLYAYGRTAGAAFVESELPQPRTIYGISKLCGEHLLAYTHAAHGTAYNVLRYLFVYGPRQFAGMGYKSVIVKNFERLLAGERPTVYGDGQQSLDYVFVDDAVEATIAALESDVSGEVFNVGTGNATTVDQLIDLMIRLSGRAAAKQFEPPDWTAGSHRVGDISKIRRLLGWAPRTSLADGLAQTFAWMESERARSA